MHMWVRVCEFFEDNMTSQGLFRLDASAQIWRRRYRITQRVQCECSDWLKRVPKPARRFYAVKLTPTRPVWIDPNDILDPFKIWTEQASVIY